MRTRQISILTGLFFFIVIIFTPVFFAAGDSGSSTMNATPENSAKPENASPTPTTNNQTYVKYVPILINSDEVSSYLILVNESTQTKASVMWQARDISGTFVGEGMVEIQPLNKIIIGNLPVGKSFYLKIISNSNQLQAACACVENSPFLRNDFVLMPVMDYSCASLTAPHILRSENYETFLAVTNVGLFEGKMNVPAVIIAYNDRGEKEEKDVDITGATIIPIAPNANNWLQIKTKDQSPSLVGAVLYMNKTNGRNSFVCTGLNPSLNGSPISLTPQNYSTPTPANVIPYYIPYPTPAATATPTIPNVLSYLPIPGIQNIPYIPNIPIPDIKACRNTKEEPAKK